METWTCGIVIIFILVIIYVVRMRGASTAESFAPFVSTQAHDMPRDDPAGDPYIKSSMGDPARKILPKYPAAPMERNSENYLFRQVNGWAVLPGE